MFKEIFLTPFVIREKSIKCATFDKNWYAVISLRENDLDYELPDYFVQCININGFVER